MIAVGSEIEGRYRILSKLDEGGMGEVYLAEHIHLGRREALKFLLPSLAADAEFASRFRREARAMNRLSHPNIAAVYDFGRAPDGRFYLAIEYAPGRNLADVVALEGALPMARATAVLEQLADAIGHAHAHGVIHRDLKPANLILVAERSETDVVKVLDFGLAKIVGADDDSSTSTYGGGLRGTVGYLAPELFTGQPASAASDVYALGCIAWEVMAGRPPYVGRPAEVMEMHLHARPPSPSEHRISGPVPVAIERLIFDCLGKDPARRPTATGIVEVLANATTNKVDARRSLRRVVVAPPRAQLGDFVEDEPTSVSDEGHDTQLDAGRARTLVLPLGDALAQYRVALRRLAEALLDVGASDALLGVRLAQLGRAELAQDRLAAEMDDLERELAAAERRGREREGALRFAMGDLRFLRDERNAREVDDQLAGLGGELTQTLGERGRTAAAITERQLEIAARAAAIEDELLRRCLDLDPVAIQDAAPYESSPEIVALRDQIATPRLMVKLAAGR